HRDRQLPRHAADRHVHRAAQAAALGAPPPGGEQAPARRGRHERPARRRGHRGARPDRRQHDRPEAAMSSVPVIAQTAGPGAARRAARGGGAGETAGDRQGRPRWVADATLGIVRLSAVVPLYCTLIRGSSTPEEIARSALPQLLPDASLFDRFADVMGSEAINFWKAAWNSVVIAVLTSLSVVLCSPLAGFSFAKLRFRGRW